MAIQLDKHQYTFGWLSLGSNATLPEVIATIFVKRNRGREKDECRSRECKAGQARPYIPYSCTCPHPYILCSSGFCMKKSEKPHMIEDREC